MQSGAIVRRRRQNVSGASTLRSKVQGVDNIRSMAPFIENCAEQLSLKALIDHD